VFVCVCVCVCGVCVCVCVFEFNYEIINLQYYEILHKASDLVFYLGTTQNK